MNRRGFLSLIGLGAAGMVLDPERLLWVPGQRTIFLPPTVSAPVPNIGAIVAAAWEQVIRSRARDDVFASHAMYRQLVEGRA